MSAPVRKTLALVLLVLVGRGFSHGISARGAPQPQTFRSGVQLIEVDVRVFDQGGRFVTGLTKEDFEVLEQGVPQRIEALFLLDSLQASRTPPFNPPPATVPSSPAAMLPIVAPAAPQTWIFFFDLLHLTPGGGFDRARKAVEDFIADRFKDGDMAGILAGDKMVNNRLTSVRQELLDAVKQVKPRSDNRSRSLEMTREWPRLLNEDEAIHISRNERDALDRAVVRACTDDPVACSRIPPDLVIREKAKRIADEYIAAATATMTAINALASGLARIPGPKTVVLLSDGFVVQQIETTLRSVVGQMARAGGRVYAIDVRGLNRVGGGDNIEQLQAVDEAGPVTRFDGMADGPNSLAVDTGGLMIRNENNIGRALNRVANDAGTYYVLAYQPANTTFDGKYRPIEVRVNRTGLRVRARRGYLAFEPAKMLKPQPVRGTGDAGKSVNPSPALVAAPVEVETPAAALPAPAAGAVVATPSPLPEGMVRLRPDSESRVKALSSRDTSPANELVTRGWEAYQRGDVEAALAAFSEAASRGNVQPWVRYATGLSYAALGRPADAVAAWEHVRKEAPDFDPVYMDLADTYAQTGDLTRALATLREAEKRWPKNGEVLSAIGVIHVRRGALDDGIVALTRAAEAKPEHGLAYLNLGRAYELRFHRGRRYVASQRRWVAPEEDRTRAAEAYQRCIKLGGPYSQKAAEALSMLEWGKASQGGSDRQ